MNTITQMVVLFPAVLVFAVSGGALNAWAQEVLKTFPLDSMEGVLTKTDVTLDSTISSDGKGSLRITASEPRVVRLFETGPLDLDDARLIYRAKLRTQDVKGQVFLEMWLHFPGKGEFFSRGMERPLTGTTEWTSEETPFFLQKGEKPDNVKINVSIQGTGTVWIDDIKLIKGALK